MSRTLYPIVITCLAVLGCNTSGRPSQRVYGLSAVKLIGDRAIEISKARSGNESRLRLAHGGSTGLTKAVVRVGDMFRLSSDGLFNDYRVLHIRGNQVVLMLNQHTMRGPRRGRNVTQSSAVLNVTPYDDDPLTLGSRASDDTSP